MTPEGQFEKIQRQMEFLAGQQAQFFASIQAHQVEIESHSEQIKRHTEQIAQLGVFLLRTAQAMENFARHTDEQFTRVAGAQNRTDERFRETDERLNALISVVERYFSNRNRH